MTPRPNFAGYLVLAAFAAAFAYVVSGKAEERERHVRVDVTRDGVLVSGLYVWWAPEFTGQERPDQYDSVRNEWVWMKPGQKIFTTPKTEVEVLSE